MKLERQQQYVEELCGASIRALTGQIDLHYRGRRLHKGARPLSLLAPHLRTDPESDDFVSCRGAADGISLRLKLSDVELYQQYQPEQRTQRFVYELMEQLRVEALAPDYLPGMKRNLQHRFSSWCLAFHHQRLTETHVGLLLYTLAQVCWARFNGCAVLEETEDLMEATRFHLMPLIGDVLYALKKQLRNQQQFAQHALELAIIINNLVEGETLSEQDAEETQSDTEEMLRLVRFISLDSGNDVHGIAVTQSGESKVFNDAGRQYEVFTRDYDRVVEAACQVRRALLSELRETLDKRIKDQGVNIPRLARKLAALLSVPQREGWNLAEEDGYLDAGRLSQLVASPSNNRIYKQERYLLLANTQVSLLIDCSGSMTGAIEPVSVLVDILARALEQAGVQNEILGYTTGAWNGGKCQQQWLARGRPLNPGRLNELCYLIYKTAQSSWRRSRLNIAALLKPDLFREGVDGEAVEWACQRLRESSVKRKILIVISDGCPMDTATSLANDQFYLDNHLRQVVDDEKRRAEIEIYALGVGLDLSPYYEHSLALDLSRNLSNQVFEEIVQLLAGLRHR